MGSEDHQGDISREINYLIILNNTLADQVAFLRQQLISVMEMNKSLIERIGIKSEIKRAPIDDSEFKPIGGYKSLSQKIADAEEASRKESESFDIEFPVKDEE